MADFAMSMKKKLEDINKHSFNDFEMKVGKCNSAILETSETPPQNSDAKSPLIISAPSWHPLLLSLYRVFYVIKTHSETFIVYLTT